MKTSDMISILRATSKRLSRKISVFETIEVERDYILLCNGKPVRVDMSCLQGTRIDFVASGDATRFTHEDAERFIRVHSLDGEKWDIVCI